MTSNELTKRYQQLNQGKKYKLVFQLTCRGFASEINNMLTAILYCLVNDMEFILYSKGWTALHKKGWQDYYLPFCRETTDSLFHRSRVFTALLTSKDKRLDNLQKKLLKHYFNTHDIWTKMKSPAFQNKEFNIPKLNIRGDIFHAKQVILSMIHRPNTIVNSVIYAQNKLLSDIKPYLSIHIRRGDKVTSASKEAEAVEISYYVDQVKKVSPTIENIFIATDDYSVIEEFKQSCPTRLRIFTFCDPNRNGYYQGRFDDSDVDNKKQEMLALFKDIYFLTESQLFIGTYSSNLARLMALIKGKAKCHSLDIEKWHPN